MDYQKLELSLLADDLQNVMSSIFAIQDHKYQGYLALAFSPALGFIAEESKNYLSKNGLLTGNNRLSDSFEVSVTKLRALLKFFDDNDGGRKRLSSTFTLFLKTSARQMNVGKTAFQRFVAKLLQPDIGIYFCENLPFYLTVAGFSAVGLTLQEIENLEDSELASLSKRAFEFSYAVGQYLANVTAILAENGVAVSLFSPLNSASSLSITHDNFLSKQIFSEVARRAGLTYPVDAVTLLYLLSQVNVAEMLLPNIFQKESNLLFRLRFLIAYHVCRSIIAFQNECGPELKELIDNILELGNLPNESKIRNSVAHYGFGEGRKFITQDTNPLFQIVEGFSGKSLSDISQLVTLRLTLISEWSESNFSKDSFARNRALLGDHI